MSVPASTVNEKLLFPPRVPCLWRGIFYREWLAHRGWIVPTLLIWFCFTWVLMLFTSLKVLLGFGLVVAGVSATFLARLDVAEGCEEFTFSLPPTRSQIVRARMWIGICLVVALQSVGGVAIRYNLPQALWGLVVESGFTRPFPTAPPEQLLVVLFLPLLGFSLIFRLIAIGRSGMAALGAFVVVVFLLATTLGPLLTRTDPVGAIVLVINFLTLVLLAMAGYSYARKDANTEAVRSGGSPLYREPGVIALLVILALLFFATLVERRSVTVRREESRQSETSRKAEVHRMSTQKGGTIQ